MTWGLGGLGPLSYRTLVAHLADQLQADAKTANAAKKVMDVADRWTKLFFKEYESAIKSNAEFQALKAKQAYDPKNPHPPATARTKEEEDAFKQHCSNLGVGFCIGGYFLPDRTATAYSMWFDPLSAIPTPALVQGSAGFGTPNMILRLLHGADSNLKASLLSSGKWSGTEAELDKLLEQFKLSHGILPIRDAIDFVHACIYSTIKAMKFSFLHQVCGGPIEIAVITSDRKFRWVRHKQWDAAINEGALL